jgi:hypothetical protein
MLRMWNANDESPGGKGMLTRNVTSRLTLVCSAIVIAVFFVGLVQYAVAESPPPTRYVMLVVDKSFSVLRSGSEDQTVEAVFGGFLDSLRVECPDCWLGIVVFGEQVTTTVELQSLSQWDTINVTDSLRVPPGLGAGTNFTGAILSASAELTSTRPFSGDIERRIVLLTDTQLDEYTYEDQKQALEAVVETTLVESKIQLVVIDTAPGDLSERWWDKEIINRTGGWYMKGDAIGAENVALQTLLWACGKPPDAVELRGGQVRYDFTIGPYQRQVEWRLTYSDEISVTAVSPIGHIDAREERRDGQINLIVDYPDEGDWSVTVAGTGTFKLFLPPIQLPTNIELGLSDLQQIQQMLPVGIPVQVSFVLRDLDRTKAISDTRFRVFADLVDEGGVRQRGLDVSFDPSCQCYRGLPNLSGW